MSNPTRKGMAKPWKPGQSGNPRGRPPGPNSSTALRKLINVEPILKKLQAAAESGDVRAAEVLLTRALPVYRTTAQPVALAELQDAATLTEKAQAILAAVADGSLAPDLGAALVSAVGNVAKVAEVDELMRRVAALEQEHAKR